MTDKNKTKLVVIVDRSGSMASTKTDMEGGFKTFIEEQAKQPGSCLVSLYQFNDAVQTVFENVDIQHAQARSINIAPTGNTALLDAVGFAMDRVGGQLKALPEDERPGAVIIMVITDGQENASREHTYASVQAKIREQHELYKWQFVYLGSDLSTHAEAAKMGIRAAGMYKGDALGINQMYTSSSKGVSNYRSAVRSEVQNASLNIDPNLMPPENPSK